MPGKSSVFVIGHRNPDTDSICSAIAYARLKNAIDPEKEYLACRAGRINDETGFVLQTFQTPEPALVEDVRTQVSDIEIHRTAGVSRTISLKSAWDLMNQQSIVTLPITRSKRLEGLITVSDITESFMDGYDNMVLSKAHTRFTNIVETLEGTAVVGDPNTYFTHGKVFIAAANPDVMESYIEKGDLVILGNRYEAQLCAIEMDAACIVVCEGVKVSITIQKLAQEHGCIVISTPFDTFTAARFINQSMPVSFYMKKDHLVTFSINDYIDDIRPTMASLRHRDFPIIGEDGSYIGMISRRNLLGAKRKQVIMVDHNEPDQAVRGIRDAEILEILDHHRLGTVETASPVYFRCEPLGCTATIVWECYHEHGVEIPQDTAGILLSAIISDTLLFRSPTCTQMDRRAAAELADIAKIDPEDLAKRMFAAGSNLRNKTPEQILFQDYKRFNIDGMEIGIGQISSMSKEELDSLEKIMKPYLPKARQSQGVSMICIMLTGILEEDSVLLYDGEQPAADRIISAAFHEEAKDGRIYLKGVVSRKKQMVPALTASVEQLHQIS